MVVLTMQRTEVVTIPKAEYSRLKSLEKMDFELLGKIMKGLEDVKAGRIKEWE